MFLNYLKIAWRNLLREKMYSAIKIGGFALGIAVCILIALFIRDELSYDRHYPEGDRIYRVVGVYNDDGDIQKGAHFPAPLANTLATDFPEIEAAGRFNSSELFGAGSKEIRLAGQEQNTYEEGFVYIDQALLNILQIPFVYGDAAHALDKPNTMVLSKRKADKYFPGENPVGKTLVLNNDEARLFTISGVMEDFPSTSHIHYDFLMTMSGVEFWPGEQTFWRASNYHTYIKVRPGTDAAQLETKLLAVIENYVIPSRVEAGLVDAVASSRKGSFELQPVEHIHLRSEGIHDRLRHGDIRFVWLFGAIASFILIIACINFINLSTAKSANRALEVGLRKTVGSTRHDLVRQFLTESLLFSFFSFGIGISLASVFLPQFNLLAGKTLIFPWTDGRFIPLMALAAVVVGILAGLYPSFYLSAFKPAQVLKGRLRTGSKSSGMRSALVVFQFTTSIVLIIGTFIIYRQMDYILHKKAGFDKEQVLLIQGTNTLGEQAITFKNELRQLPGVKNVTFSDYLPIAGTKRNGNSFWKEGKTKEDSPVFGQIWRTDHDYIKTMGMRIIEGRDFSAEIASDSQAVVINQAMVKEFGYENPLGQRLTNGGNTWEVIGVVEDFHFESMKEDIEPLVLTIGNSRSIVSVKVSPGDMAGMLRSVTAVWHEFAPNQPIRYTFLDDSFARMYDDVRRVGHIFVSFAGLAIIVACLGLFALSAFMTEQRSKEISIRRVLGASIRSIFNLLTLNFLKLVIISIVIAAPIAWYMMQAWLQDFVFRIEIGWELFLLAGLLALCIAILTISYQSIRAATINPVNNLKAE